MAIASFHPAVQEWFSSSFGEPTRAQQLGWPTIASGAWTLISAPTGSGKTLTAFLWALNELMFRPAPLKAGRCRVIYISPLKALAVDVERNLRVPLAGIAKVAELRGDAFVTPRIAIRTGDTPASERARFNREPSDILITTPESLYLMLTSRAREMLRSIETIVIDEIHALVPGKRGAHLALSLERLHALLENPPQRIGLSATQHPLEEVAHYLGGTAGRRSVEDMEDRHSCLSGGRLSVVGGEAAEFRPVSIIDTGERKQLALRVEVPVEDMSRIGEATGVRSGPSIWPAIHPRLLELIRAHRSTLIFVNSRRLAERLAAAINELAGETLAGAHHGSIARAQRLEIEESLKSGRLPALVATSSLELGIDMGAIDLVVQIEAPPSIASGMQRIGRASHQVNTTSSGVLFPKFRADLIACAAVTDAMHRGSIEPTRYPRNPLDVLAQQIVAMVAMDEWNAQDLFDAVRRAAPYAELGRATFDGVLDMLSGLYPSDEFAELRPRITWDRMTNQLTPRQGSKRVAILNGGTIPDRGLYGVFLAGAERAQSARVGELDEEMVYECRAGETFLLGASTWRIEEITHDRVLVTPAPGQPGKTPFWKAEASERSVRFGEEIGKLVRTIREMKRPDALRKLMENHDLDQRAADNFLKYLDDQFEATGAIPDDRTIVVERVVDELGDWRVCVLTPFGGKIHAPWAMAATAKIRNEMAIEVETLWSDDGFIVRFPQTDAPPPMELVIPDDRETEQLVIRQLGASSMFAARFREAAARALLLPRMRVQGRTPLWLQRKRAHDLLAVASRFGSFPIVLETYREVLRDVFDVPALVHTLKKVRERSIRLVTADTARPSPFAGSLLFKYVANFIYDGDAPMAERRAHALSIDQSQLRELLGEPELRELLDEGALHEIEQQLQHLDQTRKARSADAVHDLLLRLGDLTLDEMAARSTIDAEVTLKELMAQRRVVTFTVARQKRFLAIEDSSRYRDALGIELPAGIPERYLEPVPDPIGDLVLRYARAHGPFTPPQLALRYGFAIAVVKEALARFVERGRLVEGEFRPNGTQREWCDADVLKSIRRRSLAKLRKEVEPVDQPVLARLFTRWQHVTRKRRGLEALLDTIEMLQGYPMAASIFEREILAARIEGYKPSDLDTLSAAGEIVWAGLEPLGAKDGRIAVYLTDHLPLLHGGQALLPVLPVPTGNGQAGVPDLHAKLIGFLLTNGASFFAQIHTAAGGFANTVIEAMWDLVWKGLITNDTFHALRAFTRPKTPARSGFRSRRVTPASTEGRWSLVPAGAASDTQRATATARQLLTRYGLVTREAPGVENIIGGFSAVYPILKAMEESGRVRRGYFVAGLGATQFASGDALDLLRSLREEPQEPETAMLAATDPANPYGGVLRWPEGGDRMYSRSVGPHVILVNGALACYAGRGERQLSLFLPDHEPARITVGREVARKLAALVTDGERRAILIAEVNGEPVAKSALAPFLIEAGFVKTAMGYQLRSYGR